MTVPEYLTCALQGTFTLIRYNNNNIIIVKPCSDFELIFKMLLDLDVNLCLLNKVSFIFIVRKVVRSLIILLPQYQTCSAFNCSGDVQLYR